MYRWASAAYHAQVAMVFGVVKRLLVGRPVQSDKLGHTLLPKKIALPVFASDALSSVAYATEEILIVLSVGGIALHPVHCRGGCGADAGRGRLLPAERGRLPVRRVREPGTAFAIPTYAFIAVVMLMIVWGASRLALGHHLHAESASYRIKSAREFGGLALIFLLLRAFSSGCIALTGVEAISNGVPAFRKPKSKNAATTLATRSASGRCHTRPA